MIAAGGDGTVSSVAHALAGSGMPIMVYPAGTANLVALNLEVHTAGKVRVSESPLPVQYDGESTVHSTPFEAHVLSLAVRFIVSKPL